MPKMRTADEIRDFHKRIKSSCRNLNRQLRDEKVREETLNWVMGTPASGETPEDTTTETEEVSEEEASE